MYGNLITLYVSFFSCATFDEKYSVSSEELESFEQQEGNNGNNNYFTDGQIELVSDARCTNPCTFSARSNDAVNVRYWADEWQIGSSDSLEQDYEIEYLFQDVGRRNIKAEATDSNGNVVATDQMEVVVENNGVVLISPSECLNPCTFQAETSGDVAKIEYYADGWFLGSSSNQEESHFIEVEFYEVGHRNIKADGFDENGNLVANDSRLIEVKDSNPTNGIDLPYFYQYANNYNPGGSCQNTSIAMLLSYYGQTVNPDEISYAWGTSYGQSPAGLADLFNHYAARNGIQQRLTPIVQGTLEGLRSELDQGNPVIIHGYFTSYGHVLVVVGYDGDGYWVNDPAGEWSQTFNGGYPYGWNSTIGKGIHYNRQAFEQAVATSNGTNYLPLWYHLVR